MLQLVGIFLYNTFSHSPFGAISFFDLIRPVKESWISVKDFKNCGFEGGGGGTVGRIGLFSAMPNFFKENIMLLKLLFDKLW